MRSSALAVLAACLIPFSSSADSFPVPKIDCEPRAYLCARADQPPSVDGRLDEEAWRHVRWTEDFVDIEGDLRPTPRYRTRAKMLWDAESFYVCAEMEEPELWATYKIRDSVIYHENDFEVFIDPDGDTHEYYELELNALGTVWDLLLIRPYRDGGPAVHAWDIPGLRAAVSLEGTLNDPSDRDAGWTVEIAFPWAALAECAHRAVPPQEGDRWRVNFSRVEWRLKPQTNGYAKMIDPAAGKPYPEDNWVWSPQGLIAMHYPEMWGIVQFTTDDPLSSSAVDVQGDPDDAARWRLRTVYYAMKDAWTRAGGWPASPVEAAAGEPPVEVRLTQTGFEATLPGLGQAGGTWHIDHEGRTWRTQP